ncbi:MAG: helix-turn-helix domain-containing protein [Bryobacteraceae bacterium]|jgi:hypothetical protein
MFGFLTEREVSAILRKRPDVIKKWRRAGKGPPFMKLEGAGRRGGSILYSAEGLATWLRAQATSGAPVARKVASQ